MPKWIPTERRQKPQRVLSNDEALTRGIVIGLAFAFAGFILGMVGLTFMH